MVPHGGIFVLPIPNAVDNLGGYLIAIVAGTLVTAGMLFVLKKPLPPRHRRSHGRRRQPKTVGALRTADCR